MPKIPNCLVQQLMPTSGLTTRCDFIAENNLRNLRQNEDTFCDGRHETPAGMADQPAFGSKKRGSTNSNSFGSNCPPVSTL